MNQAVHGLSYLQQLAPWKGAGPFSLQAISKVLRRLGDPQDAYPTIHVAGTNGKGSVSVSTAALLSTVGSRIGLTISPHLIRLNERIVINGLPVNDDFIGAFAFDVRNAAHKEHIDLTFHEAITALAFLGFRENLVDWAVIEVGLGGRLDASNVIRRPACSAIVTIDFDHQHLLGDSIDTIAQEKAGIIKPSCFHITGPVGKAAQRVISRIASERSAPELQYGVHFGASPIEGSTSEFVYWYKEKGERRELVLESPLPGWHQAENLSVAATIARTVGVNIESGRLVLRSVSWPGRLEIQEVRGRTYLIDCAHNPAGVLSLTSFLDSRDWPGVELVFGVLDTKNWRAMVRQLAPFVRKWHLVLPESERALPNQLLRDEIEVSGTGVSALDHGRDIEGALQAIERENSSHIVVAGSMYMTGRFRELLDIEARPLWSNG